ncbi:MAG: DNA-directed RNA polymerase subunit omega [Tannerella sp.]|jgi:DNA-directed RNA polymerase subunit K/omega|nr:DNA-directed RNA polymerase subunit omega [Tannerella sp.]
MDYRRTNAPTTTVTRDMLKVSATTGNVYEALMIIAKRANQISADMKRDLEKKLQEFSSYNDNLEEVFENREQIEISRYYEKLPKPTLIAVQEYMDGKIYCKNPVKEKTSLAS